MRLLAFLFSFFAFSSLSAQVDFQADTTRGCAPLLVNFQALAPNAVSWSWDLGGQGSSLQNPGRIFNQAGSYTISLTVTDAAGQTSRVEKQAYIQVLAPPRAAFSSNLQQLCVGDSVQLIDNSVPGDTSLQSWLWDWGNGQLDSLQNPWNVYGQAGQYGISLTVTDANGCQALAQQSAYLQVLQPDADFSANLFFGCNAPFTTRFLPFSLSGSHQWFFGDGNGSTLSNPQHTYLNNGRYDVTHILTDSLGCRDTVSKPNFIGVGQLAGGIVVSKNPACQGDTLDFSLQSPTAQLASWDFRDGRTVGGLTPRHVFQQAGVYWVRVLVSEANGCVVRDSVRVEVRPPPSLAFFSPDTSSCDNPHRVQFFDQTPGAVQWQWEFGNGQSSTLQNPSTTYSFVDSYTVKLTITDSLGCVDSVEYGKYIAVGSLTADFASTPQRGCAPLTVDFTTINPSPRRSPIQPNRPAVTAWQWDFGDGTQSSLSQPTHTYNNPGVYDVSLILTNAGGCRDTLRRTNYILAGNKPQAAFQAMPDTNCARDFFFFTNQSTGNFSRSIWYFGDGDSLIATDATHQYRDSGNFLVQLVVEDKGCRDTASYTVHVLLPIAGFVLQPSIVCDSPAIARFTDGSRGADNWFWDFGDGNTLTGQAAPSHTYAQPGNYTIQLVVVNQQTGCTDTAYEDFTYAPVRAKFGLDQVEGCAPLRVQFSDSSFNASAWSWNFQDGSAPATVANPVHTFTQPGYYQISLVVRNASQCADVAVFYPVVVGKPAAGFSVNDSSGCAPFTVQFTDTSRSVVPLATWQWDLGIGSSNQQNPSAVYPPGYFDVQLIITDTLGCRDTVRSRDIVQATQPLASFSANFPINCINNPIRFQNTSSGQGLSYLWYFGDGDSSTLRSPSHRYQQNGTYDVSLILTDLNGCRDTLQRLAYINISSPQVSFSADTTYGSCPPLQVNFSGQALSPHPFNTWQWTFGNGNTGFQQNPSTVYINPGQYDVGLIAIAASGCRDTLLRPQYIRLDGPSGSFSFSPSQGCPGTQVSFQGQGNRVSQWDWDMGDGTLLQGQNPQHTYLLPGVYHPLLNISDSANCQVVLSSPDSIVIFDPPQAAFNSNAPIVCDSGFVQFNDQSSSLSGISGWAWDFGDGGTAAVPNPSHFYNSLQTYPVRLIVTDQNGCRDTSLQAAAVRVVPSPVVRFQPIDPVGCPPLRVVFTDLSPASNAPIANRNWNFGFGGQSSSQAIDSALYPNTGTYQVLLSLVDTLGCQGSASTSVTVRPAPQPDFQVDQTIGCAPIQVQFTDLSPGNVVAWRWDFGDGNSSTAQNPSHTYLQDGIYTVSLTVTDRFGCEGVVVKNNLLQFAPQPVPVVDAGPPVLEVCEGDSIRLPGTATNTGANLRFEWTPALGLDDYTRAQPMASPGFTTTYFFSAFSQGCPQAVADSLRLIVRARPTISPGNDYALCRGDSVHLGGTAGGALDPNETYKFLWQPAQGLDDPLAAQPLASPDQDQVYSLRVTSRYGCESDPFEARVRVKPSPIAQAGPDRSICFGDSLRLNGNHSFPSGSPSSGTVFYEWLPNEEMLGGFTPAPLVFPSQTTRYRLRVSYEGCQDEDSLQVRVNAVAEAQATVGRDSLCQGEQVRLQAANDPSTTAQYLWLPPFGLDNPRAAGPLAQPDSSIRYFLEVKEGNCVSRDTLDIRVFPLPQLEFTQQRIPNCEAFEMLFRAQAKDAQSLIWDLGDGSPVKNGEEIRHRYLRPGAYRVSLTGIGAFGCTQSLAGAQVVQVTQKGEAAFRSDPPPPATELLPGAAVQFFDESLRATSWHWDFGDGGSAFSPNPQHSYRLPGTYFVSLTIQDSLGCQRRLEQGPYEVIDPQLFIPNVFSPNQDGTNDRFRVEYQGAEAFSLQIFDRWGKLMYQQSSATAPGWDGQNQEGLRAHEGVYYYALRIGRKEYKGHVTLLR
jgi:gliding motility-associated-like protein